MGMSGGSGATPTYYRALAHLPPAPSKWQAERVIASRNARIAGLVAVWVLLALRLDAGASLTQQRLLGAGTWLLLAAALRPESRATRIQVGIVVLYASVVEYVFAGWLGVYVYRLHNVPAFVPPGHGLVYLAALALGRSAFAHRHSRVIITATVAACGAWAAWGLLLSARPDLLGALWFGCLLVFLRRGKTPLVYCGAFLVTSYLELYGTGLGTWAWQPHDPTGLLTIGNPPSGIAGGYCFFDAAALWLTPRILARYSSRTESAGAVRASATTAPMTSAPPASWTDESVSPSATAATATLTTGSTVESTAVSDGPSSARAAKKAATATTVPNTVTPARASQAPTDDGSVARVPSAKAS
jgi:disulfide bond formation protein DsbB